MAQSFDIHEVIDKSTSRVSVNDLSRKGFKHVKVLNQATISRLIAEAVDRVVTDRFREISDSERVKVIQESKKEFNSLAGERLKEQATLGRLEAENESLRSEARSLRDRVDASLEVKVERDRAVRTGEGLQTALEEARERLAENEKQVARLQVKLEERADAEQSSSQALHEEISGLHESLSSAEKMVSQFEGQLLAKNEEIERLSTSVEQSSSGVSGDPQQGVGSIDEDPVSDGKLIKSLEGIEKNLARLSMGGGTVRKLDETDAEALVRFSELGTDDSGVESNISEVEVRQAKAGGVESSLARLRQLKKGAKNDGE